MFNTDIVITSQMVRVQKYPKSLKGFASFWNAGHFQFVHF